ncbi:MAG: hypothetical protein IJW82_06075 [Clostridia bacterium]|nr:hypothetical protein [Clostridia bacterium]
MARMKMSRLNRASQFLPFDALKGLQEALRLKEYENEKVVKGELTTQKAKEISTVILDLKKRDVVMVKFYSNKDQHYHLVTGEIYLYLTEGYIDLYFEKTKKLEYF